MQIGVSPKQDRDQTSRLAMLPEAATVLSEHPAVRDAVVCRPANHEDAAAVAFVLPDEKYIEDSLGQKAADSVQMRRWRKVYDLSQLAKAAAASPFAFNIAGWNSSYTRQPLPSEDMQEWVDTTVDRISTLTPSAVLEIGCGTGLLLLRLAATAERYVGVDFAPAVLLRLREQLAQTADLNARVELLERWADNFEGFRENSFSTVIVNSAAQYFPSRTYLNQVVEQAIRVVRPGGQVFLGDQRNLRLLKATAASIEAFQAEPEVTVAELRSRVDRHIRQEQQLLLSPSYFLSLTKRFPKVSRVEIHPRRGDRDNEMTRFRFDAVLWVGPASAPTTGIPFVDPPPEGWNLGNMQSRLAADTADGIGFARIRNSRIEADIRLLDRLANADSRQTLSELREELAQRETRGIHPEAIVRLADETGCKVAISWAGCYRDGSYDAAFIRRRASRDRSFPPLNWPHPTTADFAYYSNTPGQFEMREKLADELVSHCRAKLESQSVPTSVRLVDSFPHGASGSVDCEALLSATEMATRSWLP
ncbi:MAG TPA: methyltransferase domain-containing protein [Terriglobales bacterium]|nr:methyltransferase domain-containing protein [Terriglobales bacterium]